MFVLPSFTSLWANYPHGDAESVKRQIGGSVNATWITNTCVIRISRAINLAGGRIPSNIPGLLTVKGGDNKRYALRVAEFKRFLEQHCRPADVKGDVAGQKGIIMFDVRGWSDATGHFDLWDGSQCAHQGYFEKASNVYLWRC